MSKTKQRIVLIGFGTVAQGLCQILNDKRDVLSEEHNFDFEVVGINTRSRGTMYNPEGLALDKLNDLGKLTTPFSEDRQNWDALSLIKQSNADVIVELTHTNLTSGEPAISHCKAAFSAGKSIVSGNKGPAALAYSELSSLAEQNNCHFLNEATVLSGTPVFSLVRNTLQGNRIHKIRGIMNGTTNFILSEMEADASYTQALELADNMGYLEADPAADVDGFDAQAKLTILGNILTNAPLQLKDVHRRGITGITSSDIQTAKAEDHRWKLVATLALNDNQIFAEVKPEKLPFSDPLAQVSGTANSITFSTDLLGEITISGPGAGSIETGYSILSDLLTLSKGETL